MRQFDYRDRFLLRIIIDITNRCNLRCLMCGVPLDNNKKIDMPLSLFRKIALQTFKYTRQLWLSCGYEAFLSENFISSLEYVKFVPYSVILTNGTLLNEKNINKLIEVALDRLFISFDGADKHTFEKIRVGAKFDSVVKNIELLNLLKDRASSLKPELCFSTTLMRSNIEEFPALIKLAYDLGVSTISCKPIQILFPETIEEDLTLFPDLTKDYFFQGESLAREKGIKIGPTPDLLRIINGENNSMPEGGCTNNTPEAKRCGEILPILFILPDGRVRPCTMWKEGFVGDFNTQDFWEIWEGENFKNLRSEVKNGRLRESCLRCPYRE